MKVFFTFFSLAFCLPSLFAQTGSSTLLIWMKGDNTIEQPGIYGTTGIADANNKPGARDFSATWRDNNGNLWLFGGYGLDAENNSGYLNDLWKFDPVSNKWTWIKGDKIADQQGVYGQKGTPNIANKPGGINSAIAWTDADGNFWLFGGFGFNGTDFGFLNDLWKYNPATNMWTWIKGDNSVDVPAVYGNQGVAHQNNKPGSRYGSRTWTDASGNLWLFGGYGYDNANTGLLNDLWKYSPSTNKWTWVKGNKTVGNAGSYGQVGVSNTSNNPGARYMSVSWTDANNNLWMFGGYGIAGSDEGQLNDLWKYSITTNEWTWVKGDNVVGASGIYGQKSTANDANKPGARYVSVAWTDTYNTLWLFGGYGSGKSNEGYLNDLWKYDPSENRWTWVKGDSVINQFAVYGMQGIPTVTAKSGARTSNISWTDNNGHMWFFGGFGYNDNTSGMLNDLWKVSSFLVLPLQLSYFNGRLINDDALLQWETSQEINFSHFAIQRSIDGTNFTTIARVNGLGIVERGQYEYTDVTLRATGAEKAFYRLQMVNKDSSVTYSRIVRLDRKQLVTPVSLFPNPASSELTVSFDQKNSGTTVITITDMRGIVIKQLSQKINAGRNNLSVDISRLPSAPYVLTVSQDGDRVQQKFIKR